jgi:hypothetical protein
MKLRLLLLLVTCCFTIAGIGQDKPKSGLGKILRKADTLIKKVTEKPNSLNTPPTNLTPADGQVITEKNGMFRIEFSWTPASPLPNQGAHYVVRVFEVKKGQTALDASKSNRPLVNQMINKGTSFVWESSIAKKCPIAEGSKYGWEVGLLDEREMIVARSTATTFGITSNSDYNLKVKVTKLECVKIENGNNIYNVCISSDYQSNTHNLTFNNSGSGINVTNTNYTPAYTVSAITPALAPQNNGTASTKNYCFILAVPVSQNSVIIGLLGDDINPNPSVTTQPFADTIVTLPPCACTTCDSIKIDITSSATPSQNGNNVKFTQPISTLTLPANTPLKIKSITSEILYVDIKKDDEQCYRCDKNNDHYGKFVNAACSNQFFKANNGILPLPSSGEVLFAPVLPINTPNTGSPLSNASLSFEIAAPDLNRCCKDIVTVCIKYTVVTVDCKSCSVTKCYALPRSN